MKRFTVPAALMTAVLVLPIGSPSSRADDAHHPAQGAAPAQTQAPARPDAPAPTTGQAETGSGQGQMRPGQPAGGMMMNCPMMGGQAAPSSTNCPMMQGHSGARGTMPGMGRAPQ